MAEHSSTFLNLVVDRIDVGSIKDFMLAWMKQECKDFKIVFIDKGLSEKQKTALDYARGFAEAIGLQDQICIVDSSGNAPESEQTKHLKDTTVLPVDKMEVMRLRSKHDQMKSSPTEDQKNNQSKIKDSLKQQENKEKLVQFKPAKKISICKKNDQSEKMNESTELKKKDHDDSSTKDKELKSLNQSQKVFFKIIIPNYNNIAYIKKCLDSILEQTFQDFKIIVVDDLSTDGSDKICEMYARKHADKLIYQQLSKKGYAGAARNLGLAYPIDSKFILFIDSDDWLYNKEVLGKLYNSIISAKSNVKLIKLPMYHFYGINDQKNYIHQFKSKLTLEYAFFRGCGPGRTCLASELAIYKFKENRRVANDVIWAMRCIDAINESNLLKIEFPVQTYNCISTTSGTNTIKKNKKSKEYINSMQLLVQDLETEKFQTSLVKNIQKKLIAQWKPIFGNQLDKLQIESNDKIADNICFDIASRGSKPNLIHVLVVNFGNTTNFTRQAISDLLVQDTNFDLTIIDNNSDKLKSNLAFYKLLQKRWDSAKSSLHILGLKSTIPLNHLWNYFFETTTNEWLCFLNNDVCIPENFISNNVDVIAKEKNVGIINHATNNPSFKTSMKLNYKIYDKHCNTFLHRQGWDFTIKRNLYTKIPEEFTTFVGDSIQFYGIYANHKDVAFIYSSPIIHYCSKSRQKEKEHFRKILQQEKTLFCSNAKYQIYGNANQYDFDHSLSYMHPINIEALKQNVYAIDKKIIVSMTTWKKRIMNLPVVLTSILNQTHKPDKIIINLAKDEFEGSNAIPKQIQHFIEEYNLIEVNLVDKNTKVYKKIIPTLLKYKNDLILSIDDDFIYPSSMIEDFYQTYKQHPNQPISGNRIEKFKLACHCGCASLVQYKFYAPFIENYLEYYKYCPSSDLFYTIIASKNGYTYIRTKDVYFHNMKAIQDCKDTRYTRNSKKMIETTYTWLNKKI